MYPIDVHNPLYYRSHPYKNQFDLPTSAFKNRQVQQFYSQIPQGKAYFEQTNKKHFSNMFNRSEIEQDNVLKQEYPLEQVQKSRIAMDKSYFRSLNVEDIEGAKPNTLISKAVKNREKALTKLKKQQQQQDTHSRVKKNASHVPSRQNHSQDYHTNNNRQNSYHVSSVKQDKVYKQQQAISKFNKNKSILQNNSLRVLNSHNYGNTTDSSNYQSENISSSKAGMNYHFRGAKQEFSGRVSNDKRADESSMMQKELLQKEQKIRQLERQLGLQQQYGQPSFNGANNYPNSPKQAQLSSPYQLVYPSAKPISNTSHIQSQEAKEKSFSYQQQNNNQFYQNQYRNQRQLENNLLMKNHQNFNQQSAHAANYSKEYVDRRLAMMPSTQNQRVKTQSTTNNEQVYYKSSGMNDQQNRQKSYTQKIPNKVNMNIDKRNIRKYNPTYLSYESDRVKGAIGVAAQNVLY